MNLNKKASFRKYWGFLIIYTLFIFSISSLPGNALRGMTQFFLMDKIFHILIYSGLGFLSLRTFSKKRALILSYILFSLAYCAIVGSFDEFYQKFIPQRECDFLDLLSDFLGANIGVLIYIRFSKL